MRIAKRNYGVWIRWSGGVIECQRPPERCDEEFQACIRAAADAFCERFDGLKYDQLVAKYDAEERAAAKDQAKSAQRAQGAYK